MKTNRFFTAILSVALCMNFVSCGDDEEENGGGINGNSEKRLTKIEIYTADYQTDYEHESKKARKTLWFLTGPRCSIS